MIKSIFNKMFHMQLLVNPFIWMQIGSLGDYKGVNECKREKPIIVSVASDIETLQFLPITLYSLLNQTLKPDRIILWLDEKECDLQSLPYEVTQFIKNGLEIRFVKNLNCYTKTFYAFKEFTNSIIVTADCNIYYRENWLKRLYMSYVSHPEDIHTHLAKSINYNMDSETILPYRTWIQQLKEDSSYKNLPMGDSGILYPPNCFSKEALREDVFLKNSPFEDDIWFWTIALVQNKKVRIVKNHYKTLIFTNISNQINTKDNKRNNDTAISNLMKFYGNNIINKLNID